KGLWPDLDQRRQQLRGIGHLIVDARMVDQVPVTGQALGDMSQREIRHIAVARLECVPSMGSFTDPEHVGVSVDDALGSASGTGGIDERGDALGLHPLPRRVEGGWFSHCCRTPLLHQLLPAHYPVACIAELCLVTLDQDHAPELWQLVANRQEL